MLFLTHTTFSVPALTGAIMCMGVATANSILVVSFAKDELAAGRGAVEAARGSRLHAVPAGADDGARDDHRHGADGARPRRRRRAERAARPRGHRRPALATVATLFFVPSVFALLHGIGRSSAHAESASQDSESSTPYTVGLAGRRLAAPRAVARRSRSGASPRARERWPTSRSETRELAVPTRRRRRAERGRRQQEIVLPGTMQPLTDAPIYARTNGYLRKWYVDIGARVKAGSCSRTSTPPKSISSSSRRAPIWRQPRPTCASRRRPRERYRDLIKTDSVSQQDLDNANGSLEARRRAVESARANVKRLEQLTPSADRRAVRRRHHRAQHRRRRADRLRQQRQGAVPRRRGAAAARVRQRAARSTRARRRRG